MLQPRIPFGAKWGCSSLNLCLLYNFMPTKQCINPCFIQGSPFGAKWGCSKPYLVCVYYKISCPPNDTYINPCFNQESPSIYEVTALEGTLVIKCPLFYDEVTEQSEVTLNKTRAPYDGGDIQISHFEYK